MTRNWTSFWVALVLTVGLVGACDVSLAPFAEDTGLHSVYGYLTLSGERHFLRVKPLNVPVTAGSTRTLDATVTLTNRTTGQTETLVDSIVTFDGVYTHNFRTEQEIFPGTSYRLRIERSDGRATRATAITPRDTDVEVTPPSDSMKCSRGLNAHFHGLHGESQVQVSGGVRWDDSLRWIRNDFETPRGDSVEMTGGYLPWEIIERVVPEPVLAPIPDSTEYCKVLEEKTVYLAYTHFGPDWPADSVLKNPAQSTVQNGLGVFGALRRDTFSRALFPIE